MSSQSTYKLWGGCFEEEPSNVLRRLNDSLPIDCRLYREDILGSRCWARELFQSGHLCETDHDVIQNGLDMVESEIEKELNQNGGRLKDKDEDIHSVVERRLQAHAGDAALRLHTARSRNDQSATDVRMWMLTSLPKIHQALVELITNIVSRAKSEIDIIVPGYTHLQRAQPIRWSHFLLSHVWALHGDVTRLQEQKGRVSQCPLGSGALAGCALPVDRERLARTLGFDTVTPNSMFAVSSRDHIVEFLNWASLCGLHLSRLAEDLIIYGSQEFGFIRFSDQFSTGSSLMPQKRNPDGLELVRGAAGLLLGDSFAFSCTLKGLPSTYNKDLQSDKEIIFRSFDRLIDCLKVTSGTINTMQVNSTQMECACDASMLCTDVALALCARGTPFRRAHAAAGAALRRAHSLNLNLDQLPPQEYRDICGVDFGGPEDIKQIFSWEASVEQYKSVGGTARRAVLQQIVTLENWLQSEHQWGADEILFNGAFSV